MQRNTTLDSTNVVKMTLMVRNEVCGTNIDGDTICKTVEKIKTGTCDATNPTSCHRLFGEFIRIKDAIQADDRTAHVHVYVQEPNGEVLKFNNKSMWGALHHSDKRILLATENQATPTCSHAVKK
jgi:hypothetical protein